MLETVLKDTYKALGTAVHWGWDERFNTALMVLQGDAAEALSQRVAENFEAVWDSESAKGASEEIRHLVTFLSGMRDAQRLHTRTLDGSTILFAALWPWVGNTHISYRLGVFQAYGTPDASKEAHRVLRNVFTPTTA